MKKLYELTADLIMIDELLEASGGELTPEVEKLLDEVGASFEEKVNRVAAYIKDTEDEAKKLGAESTRLAGRRKSFELQARNLKDYLSRCMTAIDKTNVKTPLYTVYIGKGRPVVGFIDKGKIPKKFLIKQEPKPDNGAILEAMKAGKRIPGAELLTGKQSLTIR